MLKERQPYGPPHMTIAFWAPNRCGSAICASNHLHPYPNHVAMAQYRATETSTGIKVGHPPVIFCTRTFTLASWLNMYTHPPPFTSTLFTPHHPHSVTSTSENAFSQSGPNFSDPPIYPYPQPSVKLTELPLKCQQGPDLVNILAGQCQQRTMSSPSILPTTC